MNKRYPSPNGAPRPASFSMMLVCTVAVAVLIAGLIWLAVEPRTHDTVQAAARISPSAAPVARRHRTPHPRPTQVATAIPQPTSTTAVQPSPAQPTVPADLQTADGAGGSDVASNQTVRTGFVWNGGHLRGGPSIKQPVVGGVDAGDVVELVRKENDWWQVKTGDTEGWLSDTLLVVDGEPDPLAPSNRGAITGVDASPPRVNPPAPSKSSVPSPMAVPVSTPKADPTPVNISTPEPEPTAKQRPSPRPSMDGPSLASGGSLWKVTIVPGHLVPLPGVTAPHAFLAPAAVGPFLRARTRVYLASGVDYLGNLDEAFRNVDFTTNKPGVARLSWHKAGRAIDVSRSRLVGGTQGVVFVPDTAGLSRVLIRCSRQDGSLGAYYSRVKLHYAGQPGFYVDVTTILGEEGFQRIPHNGGVSEVWHYELRGGVTWAQAMQQLYTLRTLRRFFPDVWR